MLKRCIDSAGKNGIRFAVLEVRQSNHSAIHFYKKTGFDVIGRRPGYYRDTGEDALIMKKHL
jgi:ribosomal-protein-alanine N-acetyltransferase